jgi:hypothetical protein
MSLCLIAAALSLLFRIDRSGYHIFLGQVMALLSFVTIFLLIPRVTQSVRKRELWNYTQYRKVFCAICICCISSKEFQAYIFLFFTSNTNVEHPFKLLLVIPLGPS